MLGIFITLFTFILILVSLFMVLVVLMQRANTNAGMGAAFGGGVADSAFGADTTNVLTRATKWSAVAYFLIASALYLMYIAQGSTAAVEDEALPEISAEATQGDATTTEVPVQQVAPSEMTIEEEGSDAESATSPAEGAAADSTTEDE